MRLSEAGELGLLGELERRGLIVGTEHDAAELEGGLVVTQDALVEDVHFRFDLLSWRELGFRAAAVNVSDLSASAAAPEALLVTLAVPPETALERVVELYEGIAEAGVPVRGGDTTSAGKVVVSVTALGRSNRVPGPGRCRTGRRRRRHRAARRRGSGIPRAPAPAPADPHRRRAPARARRDRDARHLRRARRRRRPHRAPLRLPPRRSTSTPCRSPASSTTWASARTSSCSRPGQVA